MTETVVGAEGFPVLRASVFDPPIRLGELREHQPLSRMRFADGHVGWLVTGHALAQELLSDQRFSAQPALRRPVLPRLGEEEPGMPQPPPGMFLMMDPPEHTRFRRLLSGLFSTRRMQLLEPRVTRIVDARLDAMLRAGPPADLVRYFALPVPLLVICELLGVPLADRARLQHASETMSSYNSTEEQASAAQGTIVGFMAELTARKRSEPDRAIISELLATGQLTDQEIAGTAFLLLVAGHETITNTLALGTFALLSNPDQLAALHADPALIPGAVQELLRYLAVVQFSVVRGALEDVEVQGRLIRAGESVCFALHAASHDPAKFPDPDTLDVRRGAGGHLAFGYGLHKCIGQRLAQLELRIGFTELLARIPTLRLAAAPREVPMRENAVAYGVHELPVTWEQP